MISLEGMYDFHCHPGPSVGQHRRFTALEAIKFASSEKMAGLVMKDHTYCTTPLARTLNEMGFSTKAFGVIMLNESVGGLNPSAVEIALALGTKNIELPTYSSQAHLVAYGDDQKIFPYKKRIKPIYVLDDHGRLVPEVEEIIQLVKRADAVLTSGHLSTPEIDAIVKRVKEVGCKMVAMSVSTDMPGYPLDAQKRWVSDLVFMEHAYCAITDVPHKTMPIETVVEQIRGVGAEKCILGTDSGIMKLPNNVDALQGFVDRLVQAGLTEKEIDVMGRKNPEFMLGIS